MQRHCTDTRFMMCVFPQRAVWGEPHQDHLPHVYCPTHSIYSQHACGRFPGWRQVLNAVNFCIFVKYAFLFSLTRHHSKPFACSLNLLCLRLVLDFDLLVFAFGQFPLVVCTWLCMFLSVLLVPYTLFHLWSQSQLGSHGQQRLYTWLFGSAFLLYQGLGLGILPTYVVLTNSLPPASCFIIIIEQVSDLSEVNFIYFFWQKCLVVYLASYFNWHFLEIFLLFQVRLMMKAHSFVRENVPRVLAWTKDKTSMSLFHLNWFILVYVLILLCRKYQFIQS